MINRATYLHTMKRTVIICLSLLFNSVFAQSPSKSAKVKQDSIVLVIHGGAGTILKRMMTPEREQAYTAGLNRALDSGYAILESGGTALDAVENAVRILEDDPLFNAGRGAVFTNEGRNELDAAIMDGKTLAAGSVAGVTTVRNPISAARAVMEKSPHVMMAGAGADAFAKQSGLEIVDPSYFYTEDRWKGLQRVRAEDSARTELDHGNGKAGSASVNRDSKFGTVGAVARDRYGNLAAATSTGGMTNKKFGRIGDAPIIGAGTYANNKTCAISCTGWGEYFIRLVMAKSISDMMEFGNWSLARAAGEMVMKRLPALGGDGGLIAVDAKGNIALPFNTEGMYRGWIKNGKREIRIYKDQ